MRKLFFILLLATILVSNNTTENQQPVHLSYNITNSDVPLKKYMDKRGCASFYIGDEYFKATGNPQVISKSDIEKLDLISIDSLIALSNKKRKDSIDIDEKNGVLKILMNSEIFDTIYIYEKYNGKFFKHRVDWIEQVID